MHRNNPKKKKGTSKTILLNFSRPAFFFLFKRRRKGEEKIKKGKAKQFIINTN